MEGHRENNDNYQDDLISPVLVSKGFLNASTASCQGGLQNREDLTFHSFFRSLSSFSRILAYSYHADHIAQTPVKKKVTQVVLG